MPNIVLVTGGLDCGGAQRVMADMANYWAERGWEVTLATWSGPELQDFYALSPEISRIWLNVAGGEIPVISAFNAFVGRVLKLRRALRGLKPDAVLSFIDVSNIHTILAAAGLGVRVVVSERTHPGNNRTISPSWALLRRIFYRWADQVVAQTEDAAAWIERRCRTGVVVIPNGVRELPTPSLVREPLVIAVGRLSAEKGFDLALAAFASLREQFPQWRMCLIGDGPQREALTQLAKELNMQGRVKFLGQVRDVEPWMACAAVMVHPSRREGFPNAVLEAMAMGVAVICTDCHSGPAELIADGINGRLIPVDDLDALTRAMTQLMADSKTRERLAQQALEVRLLYSQAELMRKWEACILSPRSLSAYRATQTANSG